MRQHPGPQSGFTLIELMIVISIIGILASIAIPEMKVMTLRAKRSEREAVIRGIASAIKTRFITNEFPNGTIFAVQNPPGPVDGSPLAWSRDLGEWRQIPFAPEGGRLYHRYSVEISKTPTSASFTIIAESDLDSNGVPCTRVLTYERNSEDWVITLDEQTGDTW